MTLAELQRSHKVHAAKWTHSEQQLVFSEVLGLSLTACSWAKQAHLLCVSPISFVGK